MDLLRKYRQDSSGVDGGEPTILAAERLGGADLGGGVAATVADVDADLADLDANAPPPPERIPIPADLAAPCPHCEALGRGPNPLYWQDRFGVIHCAGCRPCPSRVMFRRFLQLKGVAGPEGVVPADGRWLEERELGRNPWLKPGGGDAQAVAETTEGY